MQNEQSPERWDVIVNEKQSQKPRMLIVWSWLPSNHLGAGILMRRLFADYPSGRLWALTSYHSVRGLAEHDPAPPAERQIPVPEVRIHRRWTGSLSLLLNYMLIPWTVRRGVQLVRAEQIEAIFTVPWDHFTIAAYFIHRITGLPIYMYVMDDPAGTRQIGAGQPVMYSLFMPRLLRAARRVWGVSDGMCEYFEMTYGVKCMPLLPLLDLENFRRKSVGKAVGADGTFHIVYTGSIYSAQLDSVRRLVRVVNKDSGENGHRKVNLRLTLYTSLPQHVLEEMNLVGKNIRRCEVDNKDIPRVMAEADVAFLPLSFEPSMRHVVETSFPSKIGEYLASGIPILVHAPSYSSVARYCRENNCGLVVAEPSETSLRDALNRLISDGAIREKLSARALEVAAENHDVNRIVPAFFEQIR